jgi:hypothetical protein
MDSGLRGQLGTEANRRHLRELPIFQADFRLPQQLSELLQEIDRAEQKGADRRK